MSVDAPGTSSTPSSYRPAGRRSTWTVVLVSLTGAIAFFSVFSTVRFLNLINQIGRGEPVDQFEVVAAGERVDQLDLMSLVFVLGASIPFLMWFHRMYKNLVPLGARHLRFGPGWAIGSWFVPILNLFRPKQIADDIWRASDPELPREEGTLWRGKPVPPWLHLWWTLFLISGPIEQIASGIIESGTTLDTIRTAIQVKVVADITWGAAAIFALVLVVKTTARQEQRAATLAAA